MKQSTRIQVAKSTLEIIDKGFYLDTTGKKIDIKEACTNAITNTRLYTPEELDEMLAVQNRANNFITIYEVVNETTLDAARRLTDEMNMPVLCLNFASAKNPGGGFLGGAVAQEECIARASALYPCLLSAKDYYTFHRKLNTCLYSDHMIYSPQVPVIKDEEGTLLDKPAYTSIITSPAVNAGVIRRNEPLKINEILPVMEKRIKKLLALALHYQHNILVLGAWGCGVFQNNPEDIARLFHESLTGNFANQFKKVVFAVKTNNEQMIKPFQNWFS